MRRVSNLDLPPRIHIPSDCGQPTSYPVMIATPSDMPPWNEGQRGLWLKIAFVCLMTRQRLMETVAIRASFVIWNNREGWNRFRLRSIMNLLFHFKSDWSILCAEFRLVIRLHVALLWLNQNAISYFRIENSSKKWQVDALKVLIRYFKATNRFRQSYKKSAKFQPLPTSGH